MRGPVTLMVQTWSIGRPLQHLLIHLIHLQLSCTSLLSTHLITYLSLAFDCTMTGTGKASSLVLWERSGSIWRSERCSADGTSTVGLWHDCERQSAYRLLGKG